MLKFIHIAIVFLLSVSVSGQTFKATQQKAARVKSAYAEKWDELRSDLTKSGIKENFELYMRVFKEDKIVEVWLKSVGEKEFELFKTY